MKKIIIICLLTAGIYACNDSNPDKKATGTTEGSTTKEIAKVEDHTDSPEFQKGLELVKGSDCITCHKIDEKVIGPAFREIANRYHNDAATIDTLAHKIIAGGQGNWGNIPMLAHASLPLDDAKAMAKYILLLKNN